MQIAILIFNKGTVYLNEVSSFILDIEVYIIEYTLIHYT